MNIMGICIMLGVLLCTALLCIVMLSGLLTREIDGRAADKLRFDQALQQARRRVDVTHMMTFDRAARHFYDQEKGE